MPKIFIDTNVLLDFYESRKESLKILLELQHHSDSIVFPSLVYDEFLRNRVNTIAASGFLMGTPNILCSSPFEF